ncbi:MAG TPA: SAM-dependent methyltransferase [Terrimicrobiaceae bacterium]|nr:SAM-dependent methyltransferase [Terrimicrobiaceae bacterium]
MCAKSPALADLIAAEIADSGPLTFARYMALALYHPELGYYASGRAKIGPAGDFFTSVSVGPVFGRILAGQFGEIWQRLGQPPEFSIVEQGANDGTLAADVLNALDPRMNAAYWIIEPSPVLQDRQRAMLQNHASRVRWVSAPEELPVIDGLHFSNELLDALPFHLVRSTGSAWEELFVVSEGGRLAFSGGVPTEAVAGELTLLPARPAGYIAELRPSASAWAATLGTKIRSGAILVIDYGYSRDQLLAPHRTEGTFACYRAHQRDALPLEAPGEKDITAHVDFTALTEAAAAAGFHREGWTDQHHFLVGASQELMREIEGPPTAQTQKILRTLQTLLHPESMGTQFHCLLFTKNLPGPAKLSGFQFARAR